MILFKSIIRCTSPKDLAGNSFDLTITDIINQPDNDLIRLLDTSDVGPDNDADRLKLQQEMGFKYRAATGELLFAMVTCGPDISNAVIKLTQFNTSPDKWTLGLLLVPYTQ